MSSDLKRKIADAIGRKSLLEPMRRAFGLVVEKQEENAGRIPDLAGRLERLRGVRMSAPGETDLLEQAIRNLENNGFRVRPVGGREEAVRAVLEELGGERLLVKSKSNLSREIGLITGLAKEGVTVIETDIGDRVIQLSGERPVHPTGPCAGLTRFDIARVLSEHLGAAVDPEPASLVKTVREDIERYVADSRVGLIGTNAVTAEEGAVVSIHNEGNVDLVSTRPGKLIVLASPDKIYPDLEEAINMAKLASFYATGEALTSFIRVIGGPSKTADVEKITFRGVHGPSELVVLIIDNGRSELLRDPDLAEALGCIGCGSCLLECPVYAVLGPEYGAYGRPGGIGLCLAAHLDLARTPEPDEGAVGVEGHPVSEAGSKPGDDDRLVDSIYNGLPLCLTCRNCVERCPVSLEVPDYIEKIRARASSRGLLPIDDHVPLISSIRNYGNPWMQPRHKRNRWAKEFRLEKLQFASAIFFAGCSLSFVSQEVAEASIRVLQAVGVHPLYLGRDELCCGGPLLRLGEKDLFLELARNNIENFNIPGVSEIITVCPGCLKALGEYREHFPAFDLRVRHVTEVVADALDAGLLAMKAPKPARVTYHDPCHLGRGRGIYDEPRALLSSIEGLELVEMPGNREYSACCGAGGGVKTGFPEMAMEIGQRRAEMASAVGAEEIVTCCPWCEHNLADSMAEGDYRVPVRDLTELILESLVPVSPV